MLYKARRTLFIETLHGRTPALRWRNHHGSTLALLFSGLLSWLPATSTEAIEYSFQTIQVPEAVSTIPFDVSNEGIVVGSYSLFDGGEQGFKWNGDTFDTPDIALEGVAFTGINDAGVILGTGTGASGFPSGFKLTGAELDLFSYPGSLFTLAQGINNDGEVVGNSLFQAFVKRGDVYEELIGPIEDAVFTAEDINDEGTIVGGLLSVNGPESGIFFRDGVAETVDHPDGSTELLAINNSGSIAGGVFSDTGERRSFIFDGETFSDVAFPGAEQTIVRGINDRGIIVGSYFLSEFEHGFIGVPVPEPTSLAMFAIGLTYVVRPRRLTGDLRQK